MKKIKLSSQMKLFLFTLVVLYVKTQAFYFMTWSAHNIMLPVITIGVLGLFLLPILFMQKEKNQKKYSVILNASISFLLLANAIYYVYANNFLSIFQLTNAKYGGEIASALPSLIRIYHLVFVIDFICYGAKKAWMYLKKVSKEASEYTLMEAKCKKKAVCAIILLGMFSLAYCGLKPEENLKKRFWSKNTLIAQSTIFGYHYYDIVNFFTGKKNVPYKTFNEVAETYKANLDVEKMDLNKYLDVKEIAKGKNVILLQLEAIQNFIINEKINGKEITPNINKWLAENIHFTNMHAQGLGTTADSEHTVLNSLYPLENGSVYQFYAGNKYYNLLGDTVKKNGYYTSFMHANDKGFWNRFNVYKNAGVDVFEDLKAFEPINEWISCWPSDEEFFREGVEKLASYPKPFLSNMVAVTSHYPFSLDKIQNKEEKINIDVAPYNGTTFGNYLLTANYVDYAFGILIEELKAKGLYDDTVIIMYGDHYAMNIDDKDMLTYLDSIGKGLNKIEQKVNYTNVACGMRIPGVSNLVVDDPVGKADIKPTILKMLGIEDKFSIGKDMFIKDGHVNISNYNIITREDMYADGRWYNIQSGEDITDKLDESKKGLYTTLVENMRKEIEISESIIKKDLLKDAEKVEQFQEELNK